LRLRINSKSFFICEKLIEGGMKMKEIQVIKSMNDANKLLDLGHQIKKIDRDRKDRDYLIFLFWNSDRLQKDLKTISNKL
jgi:hypothetical protein